MKKLCVILVALLVILCSYASSSVEASTVIGLKNGAGAGILGLEIENEFDSGLAVGIVGGLAAVLNPVTLDPIAGVSAAGTVRYYIATSGNVRPFGGGFGGIVAISDGTTNITIPLFGVTGGAELRLGKFRITGELGYGGTVLESEGFIGALASGVSLGYIF